MMVIDAGKMNNSLAVLPTNLITHVISTTTANLGTIKVFDSNNTNNREDIFAMNETISHFEPEWRIICSNMLSFSLPITNVVMMLAMGCVVDWRQILKNIWPPIGVLTGLCGQFVILPAIAFLFTHLFKLSLYQSLGALIVCSCPGGAFSNFFVHYVDGNLPLSIVMTTCSTLVALVMMPLNIWMYLPLISKSGTEEEIVVPYKSIFVSLGMVIGPLIIGMIIRHFKDNLADKLSKIIMVISYVGLVISIILTITVNLEVLLKSSVMLYIMSILLPMAGFCGAYLFAFIIRMSHKTCLTIGMETGCQNIPIAIGVILHSFSDLKIRGQLLTVPTVYGNLLIIEMVIGSYLYNLIRNNRKITKQKKDRIIYDRAEKSDEQEANYEELLQKKLQDET